MTSDRPRQLQSMNTVDWIGAPGGELSSTPESPISEPISSVGSGKSSRHARQAQKQKVPSIARNSLRLTVAIRFLQM